MSNALWILRFYTAFDETNTINFVGNIESAGKRYLDDIVVFSGMYGVEDYMLWYVHKDLVSYNFAGYSVELKLYLNGDPKSCYFRDRYRIVDVSDDFGVETDRKLVYAIQEDYAKLKTLLIDAGVTTLEYKETRTPEDVLREVLEKNGIFPVIFCEHDDPNYKSFKFEYCNLSLDPSWTVGDFIKYIAEENNFEWTIKFGILFIGPELKTYKLLNATKDFINRNVDNISKNYFTVKLGFAATPLNVLYYQELKESDKLTDMRCVWAKHWVGTGGDLTKGCFVPVGTKIGREFYERCLEGEIEKLNAKFLFSKEVKYKPIQIGRIVEDEGESETADFVSITKKIENYATKTPRNIQIETEEPVYGLFKVGRTTPYLDDMFGIFFPIANDLTKTANQLLFSPYNRIEQSILGPYVMGNGDTGFIIPAKNPKDFRLQLPLKSSSGSEMGWCLYHNYEEEQTYLIPHDADPTEIIGDGGSDPPSDKFWIKIGSSPKILINISEDTYISISNDEHVSIVNKGDFFVNSQGTSDLRADGDITINSSGGKLDVDADGDITLDTANGKVTITSSSEVKITVGSSTITITSSSITMTAGSTATLNSSGLDVT